MMRLGEERRLRVAGVAVALALLIELVTLRWVHPAAFLAFLLVSGPLIVAGVLLYLSTLLRRQQP